MRLLWLSMICLVLFIQLSVTDLDGVTVKYFAEAVILREVFVN